MAHTQDSLSTIPGDETKLRIGEEVFGNAFDPDVGLECFQEYFKYYDKQIDWLRRGVTSESDQLTGVAARTHDDIITIIRTLREHADSTRPQIRDKLRNGGQIRGGEDSDLDRAIDIALRLWLLINIRPAGSGIGVGCVRWNEKSTLRRFLRSLFPVARWGLGAKERRLDTQFIGANMVKFCKLTIKWTNSLEDHLRLDRRRRILWVFPYKRTLLAVLSQAETDHNSPLPVSLLKETIRTLDLLFPSWHKETGVFLKKKGQSFHDIVDPLEHGRTLHLLDFHHWRDRLLQVSEDIYQSPPSSWAQLWNDTRNPQQFYTFWIALVILGLTLVSTVTSVVSMVTSIVQMNLALAAAHQQVSPVVCGRTALV